MKAVIWQPGVTLADLERDAIFAALQFFRNNKVHAAKALGICYKTLNNKLAEYNGTSSLQSDVVVVEPVVVEVPPPAIVEEPKPEIRKVKGR